MRPSGNVLPAYWCVWLHVVWLCCGKESNGKILQASCLVLEFERIVSKYSSVNPNIFFYHLQTILFMGTKPARRCEKRHKNRWNFCVNDMLGTLILGKIHKEMESYFCVQSSCFLRWFKKYLELGKSPESICFDSSSFQTVSEDTTGCLTGPIVSVSLLISKKLTKERGLEKMLSRWIWKCPFTDYHFFKS